MGRFRDLKTLKMSYTGCVEEGATIKIKVGGVGNDAEHTTEAGRSPKAFRDI